MIYGRENTGNQIGKKHSYKGEQLSKYSLSHSSLCFLPFIYTFQSHDTKRQRGNINAQQTYLTAAIQFLFVLTDGGKSNQILFRAAIAQNQYYIRRPDEFEICTQSGY